MKIAIGVFLTVVSALIFYFTINHFYIAITTKHVDPIISLISVFVSGIALFWLIMGYQQQAEELKLQRTELTHQVENTAKLVAQAELQSKANLELLALEKNRIQEEHIHSIRPMLVFSNTGTNDRGGNMWLAKNVGNSSAINVIISSGGTLGEWNEVDTVLFSALNLNDIIELSWVTRSVALVAIYLDIEENQYTTTCFRNKNTITKGNLYPGLIHKKVEWQMKNELKNKSRFTQ